MANGPARGKAIPIALGVVLAVYPVAVWAGLAHHDVRTVAILLLLVLGPLLVLTWRRAGGAAFGALLAPLLTVVAIAVSAAVDDPGWLLLEPVVISAALLLAFGVTLRRGAMPMVERFARLQDPELTFDKQQWCRTWTWIWCSFFVVNGATAWTLAVAAPMAWWVAYTTTLAYVLMGCLFATEWLLRRRRFFRG